MGTAPDEQQKVSLQQRSVTLAAGVPQEIASQNNGRSYLLIQNTGENPLTIGFGAAPASAGAGLSLDAAAAAGGQGGVYEAIEVIPVNAIHALSAAGTTIVVIEG